MDLQRTLTPAQRWRRRASRPAFLGLALLVLLGLAGGLLALRLRAAPIELTVSARGLQFAAVERGPLALDVRGSGVLVSSDPRWITAQSEARVERLHAQAGGSLRQGELLMLLSNPQLQQRAQESRWQLEQAEAELKALQASLDSLVMNAQAAVQRAEFGARSAELQWQADQELLKDGMVSKLAFQRSRFSVEQAGQTLQLERELLQRQRAAMQAQLEAKRAALARLHKAWQRDLELVEALQVRAPADGVVQELTLQAGQSVVAGALLAKLARGRRPVRRNSSAGSPGARHRRGPKRPDRSALRPTPGLSPGKPLWDNSAMQISAPCVVSLSWRLEDAQGQLIDELAEPLEFFYGGSDLFAKVEEALAGQETGFEAAVALEPEHAFGDYDSNLVCFESRSLFPDGVEAGMQIEGLPEGAVTEDMPDGLIFTVTETYPEHVVLDGNHPLAGVGLRMYIKVRDVREATAEEIEAGSLGEAVFSVGMAGAPDGEPLH